MNNNLKLPKFYYINLEKSKERNQNMIKFFDNLQKLLKIEISYERLNAYNAKNDNWKKFIEDKQVNVHSIYVNSFTNILLKDSQFGCVYSHFLAIKKFYESDDKYAIICEDDLEPEIFLEENKIKEIFRYLFEKIDESGIISLSCNGQNSYLKLIFNRINNYCLSTYIFNHFYGTGCYLINREKANFLLSTYTNYFYDLNLLKLKNLEKNSCVADILLYQSTEAHILVPSLFLINVNIDSTIDSINKSDKKSQDLILKKWENLEWTTNRITKKKCDKFKKKIISSQLNLFVLKSNNI